MESTVMSKKTIDESVPATTPSGSDESVGRRKFLGTAATGVVGAGLVTACEATPAASRTGPRPWLPSRG